MSRPQEKVITIRLSKEDGELIDSLALDRECSAKEYIEETIEVHLVEHRQMAMFNPRLLRRVVCPKCSTMQFVNVAVKVSAWRCRVCFTELGEVEDATNDVAESGDNGQREASSDRTNGNFVIDPALIERLQQ